MSDIEIDRVSCAICNETIDPEEPCSHPGICCSCYEQQWVDEFEREQIDEEDNTP